MSTIVRRAMSRFTIPNLPRVEAHALAEQLLAHKDDHSVAVVDVRDGDHIGGHIKGSQWVPSHQFDEWLPTLLRQLENKKTVVFHCALSKQRGPSAALRYIRAREEKFGEASVEAPDGSTATTTTISGGGGGGGDDATTEPPSSSSPSTVQKVCVLRGGFQRWQELHGPNEQLTEAYVKDLWDDY